MTKLREVLKSFGFDDFMIGQIMTRMEGENLEAGTKVPLYLFVGSEPISIGNLTVRDDATIHGAMSYHTYKLLEKSQSPMFFALHPERKERPKR